MVVVVTITMASHAVLFCWTPTLLALRMTPLTVTTLLICPLHRTTEVYTSRLVQVEVRIALQTLELGRTIATLAISMTSFTNSIIYPEAFRTLSHTRSMSVVIESK